MSPVCQPKSSRSQLKYLQSRAQFSNICVTSGRHDSVVYAINCVAVVIAYSLVLRKHLNFRRTKLVVRVAFRKDSISWPAVKLLCFPCMYNDECSLAVNI